MVSMNLSDWHRIPNLSNNFFWYFCQLGTYIRNLTVKLKMFQILHATEKRDDIVDFGVYFSSDLISVYDKYV